MVMLESHETTQMPVHFRDERTGNVETYWIPWAKFEQVRDGLFGAIQDLCK
jgi:hypothetical protein